MRLVRDVREAGFAQGLERALPAFLEGPLARLLAAPLRLGLVDPPLELGMTGQEKGGERLRLLDHDEAARSDDAGKLLEGGLGVGDVVQHVATPEPVEG